MQTQKRFSILMMSLLFSSVISYAQCDTLPIKIPDRVFTINNEINTIYGQMIDSLLFIVKSEYVLVNKNSTKSGQYGRMGNAYYGRKYEVGALADGKLWFNHNTLQPWYNDTSITNFSDSLKPQVSSLNLRALYEKNARPVNSKDFNQLDIFSTLLYSNHHATINWWQNSNEQQGGRLVLLCNIANDNDSKLIIQKYFCKIRPAWTNQEAIVQVPDFVRGRCIGGVFFYEKLRAGSLQLYLGGLVEIINETTVKLTKIHEQQKINIDSADSTNR